MCGADASKRMSVGADQQPQRGADVTPPPLPELISVSQKKKKMVSETGNLALASLAPLLV